MWKKYWNRKRAQEQLAQISTKDWMCSSCEEKHSGLFDLASFSPDFWTGEKVYSSNSDVRLSGDFLSEDFCIIEGESFFVRSILELPIQNIDYPFSVGVWSTLSKENFKKYIEGFDKGDFNSDTEWTGWFSNQIKGIEDTIRQKCWVIPQINRQRPLIRLMNEHHAVSIAQNIGLTAEQFIEIYAANGHAQKTDDWRVKTPL